MAEEWHADSAVTLPWPRTACDAGTEAGCPEANAWTREDNFSLKVFCK
jgi:hypothetical protein